MTLWVIRVILDAGFDFRFTPKSDRLLRRTKLTQRGQKRKSRDLLEHLAKGARHKRHYGRLKSLPPSCTPCREPPITRDEAGR
jgi:hypothetical protein